MFELSKRSLLLAGCAAASACVTDHSAGARLPENRAVTIDNLVTQLTSLAMFNGTLAIDIGGETVYERSYGLANYASRVPFTPRTRFKIASLSKPMTDAALVQLLARGSLRLDDRLSSYLPQFPDAERITIELVTKHRSGIPHTNNLPWGEGPERLDLDEILARLAVLPLDFEPGSQRRYSNGGYAALARVLEIVAQKPYSELMDELVFSPLGMLDSFAITDSRAPPDHLATGYQPGENIGDRAAPRPYLVELRPGGGSLCASARDVMRFFRAAWRGRLPGANDYPDLFGGAGPTRAADGRSPGFYMDVYYDAGADLIVCSTANNYAAEFRWAENIAKIAMGVEPLFSSLPEVDLSRIVAQDDPLLGDYRDENGTTFNHSITRSAEGRLILADHDGGVTRALIPLRDGSYLEPMYYGICRADAAELGRLQFNRLYEGGFSSVLRRRER